MTTVASPLLPTAPLSSGATSAHAPAAHLPSSSSAAADHAPVDASAMCAVPSTDSSSSATSASSSMTTSRIKMHGRTLTDISPLHHPAAAAAAQQSADSSTSNNGNGAAAHDAADARVSRSHGLRVLLVDDNTINLSILSMLLKRRFSHLLACAPVCVDSGLKAFQLLRAGIYDVIFMDIQMPYLNGVECTRRIRAGQEGILPANRNVHIAAVTTAIGPEPEKVYRAAGFDGCIGKPVRFEHLQPFIASLAEEADLARASRRISAISISSPVLEPSEETDGVRGAAAFSSPIASSASMSSSISSMSSSSAKGYVARQRTFEVLPPLPPLAPHSAPRTFYLPRSGRGQSRERGSSISSSSAESTSNAGVRSPSTDSSSGVGDVPAQQGRDDDDGGESEEEAYAQQFKNRPEICETSSFEEQLKQQTRESLKEVGAIRVARSNSVSAASQLAKAFAPAPVASAGSAAVYTRVDQLFARVGSPSKSGAIARSRSSSVAASAVEKEDNSGAYSHPAAPPSPPPAVPRIDTRFLAEYQVYHSEHEPAPLELSDGATSPASSCPSLSSPVLSSNEAEWAYAEEAAKAGAQGARRARQDSSTPLVMHLAVDAGVFEAQISRELALQQQKDDDRDAAANLATIFPQQHAYNALASIYPPAPAPETVPAPALAPANALTLPMTAPATAGETSFAAAQSQPALPLQHAAPAPRRAPRPALVHRVSSPAALCMSPPATASRELFGERVGGSHEDEDTPTAHPVEPTAVDAVHALKHSLAAKPVRPSIHPLIVRAQNSSTSSDDGDGDAHEFDGADGTARALTYELGSSTGTSLASASASPSAGAGTEAASLALTPLTTPSPTLKSTDAHQLDAAGSFFPFGKLAAVGHGVANKPD